MQSDCPLQDEITTAAESEGVNPEAHLPWSHTGGEQEITNTDIRSALIAHIVTDTADRENIIIAIVCSSFCYQ